ncbi:MAG: hypothetical protein JOZ99_03120, partial [Actinobacteria bacterium]|nr:hypothetical protein [Actinomycetota bacterium]
MNTVSSTLPGAAAVPAAQYHAVERAPAGGSDAATDMTGRARVVLDAPLPRLASKAIAAINATATNT